MWIFVVRKLKAKIILILILFYANPITQMALNVLRTSNAGPSLIAV